MTLVAFRDAIVETLASQLPRGVTVQAHDGSFGAKGSQLSTVGDVAIFVTALGVTDVEDMMPPEMAVNFAAHVFVRRVKDATQTRGDAAMALADCLVGIVSQERWGLDTRVATAIRADNLYSPDLMQQGFTLWIVSWRQSIRHADVLTSEEALDNMRRLLVTYNLVPRSDDAPLVQDQIDLEAPL